MAGTTAGVLLTELRQLTRGESLNGIADRLRLPAMKDPDTDLLESHQRAETHAARDHDLHSSARQVLDRSHATSLLMRDTGQDLGVLDFIVLHRDQRETVTVTKMLADCSFEAAGVQRGNRDDSFQFNVLPWLFWWRWATNSTKARTASHA